MMALNMHISSPLRMVVFLLGILWLLTTFLAYKNAISSTIPFHRQWALRSVLLMQLFIVFSRAIMGGVWTIGGPSVRENAFEIGGWITVALSPCIEGLVWWTETSSSSKGRYYRLLGIKPLPEYANKKE
eukprot:TRINITY_DN13528_c0_g1_i2.p2 TRINITY_DN13528_c0_g1~~TRINITY_DN13528_c0_g1_i2.p2  ORF type:complete len:129 (+),score=30.44 TRINITY_DN13528_c0_g1_i2:398-784(+)